MKWPEEVTMVTSRDIHRGFYDGPRGTHCALGWAMADGLEDCTTEHRQFERLFCEQASLLAARGAEAGCAVDVNDNPRNPKKLIARLVNRTWAKLGYVVNNPECDSRGRLFPVR